MVCVKAPTGNGRGFLIRMMNPLINKIKEVFAGHHYILDNEQPTTCPKCGARVYFVEIRENKELRHYNLCLNKSCKYEFVGEFEGEA